MELGGVRAPQDMSYIQCGERSDSGYLCFSCTRILPSNEVLRVLDEVGGLLACCLFTQGGLLLLAVLSAHCYFPTRY